MTYVENTKRNVVSKSVLLYNKLGNIFEASMFGSLSELKTTTTV